MLRGLCWNTPAGRLVDGLQRLGVLSTTRWCSIIDDNGARPGTINGT